MPSRKVATYDLKPEISAREVAKASGVLAVTRSPRYDLARVRGSMSLIDAWKNPVTPV